MATHLQIVLPVICHLNGAKNGLKIGKMLSSAAKDVLAR
jgi:hypothetical protein